MEFTNFVLGTANLGMAYGINNKTFQNWDDSQAILKHAISTGISTFDTAADYGMAENLIGQTIDSSQYCKIITKVPIQDSYNFEYVSGCLEKSLQKLRRQKIYGLMFHDPEMHKKSNVQELSKRLLDSGQIEHIGVSSYALEGVLAAKEKNPILTIFQVPENILDRRLIHSTELSDLSKENNSIFVRSIFLQGLILRNSKNLPNRFQGYKDIFENLRVACEQAEISILDACLSYAASITWNSGTVIAAASLNQLDEILNYKSLKLNFDKFDTLPDQILDPRRWRELE